MKRLLIVYNPRSSQYKNVKAEVLDASKKLNGYMVGKYEVENTDVDKNAKKLAKILEDGDLVVTAGGDGTVSIALNAIMNSEVKATLGVLPYGNFNDTASTLGTKTLDDVLNCKTKKVWPLEAKIDGEHFRYAFSYFTMGLFAEACAVFDDKKTRNTLRKGGHKTPIYSWLVLARWYFKNRSKRVFLPEFKLNGELMSRKTTDVVAVNGVKMAGVMRGGKWAFDSQGFLVEKCGLKSFWRLFKLMARSILRQVPGKIEKQCVMEFTQPAEFEIQVEGEYKRLKDVAKLEIRKTDKPLEVIAH